MKKTMIPCTILYIDDEGRKQILTVYVSKEDKPVLEKLLDLKIQEVRLK